MSFKSAALAVIATSAFLAPAGTATAATPQSQLKTCVRSKFTEHLSGKSSAKVTIKGIQYLQITKTWKTVGSTVFYRNPRGICRGRIYSENREISSYRTVTRVALHPKSPKGSGGIGKAYGPVSSEPVHHESGGGA